MAALSNIGHRVWCHPQSAIQWQRTYIYAQKPDRTGSRAWRRQPDNHPYPTIGNPCWLWSRWRSRRLPEPGRIVVKVFQASFAQGCSSSGVSVAWQLASSLAQSMWPDTGSPIDAARSTAEPRVIVGDVAGVQCGHQPFYDSRAATQRWTPRTGRTRHFVHVQDAEGIWPSRFLFRHQHLRHSGACSSKVAFHPRISLVTRPHGWTMYSPERVNGFETTAVRN